MELLAVVLGAFVAGLISWALAGWQHRKQAAAALAQLEEQSRIARSHARAEMHLRMQVEEFQELKRIDQIIFKEFVEIDHLTATDRWKAFIQDPQENNREDARSAWLEARRALFHLVEERGRALGAEEDGDPLARET